MAIKTQGTELYVIDPGTGGPAVVLKVGKATAIQGIDTSIPQIDTTALDDNARTYLAGLATPGNATFDINFDPKDASHARLHELKTAGTMLKWAVCLSDGAGAPVLQSGGDDFDLAAVPRTMITFNGYMSSYPFNLAIDSVVKSTIGIQVSGEPLVTAKA